ncbi:hypothetical protein [uncultured Fibrobacter sp.]|uniref:hypothetical protein n=1 Tax=uncultured Fibrobacter sp. TaxID=261512 RepID=UPI002805AC31|nr:hypothetical protein [uncultured Fibrobacter sp.]
MYGPQLCPTFCPHSLFEINRLIHFYTCCFAYKRNCQLLRFRPNFCTKANVRVQDDVIDASAFNRLPHRKVVARSVAEVHVVDVADRRKILLQNPPSVISANC